MKPAGSALAVALSCATLCPRAAEAQTQPPPGLVQPVYRVADATAATPTPTEQPAVQPTQPAAADQQPAQVAARIVEPAAAQAPFNLDPIPGQHPLVPALKVAEECLKHIDATIQDYQAVLIKRERIDGELMDKEVAFVKVRHQPFSVYMFFLSPNKGQECLYVAGPNGEEGKIHALGSGLKRKFGVFEFGVHDRMVMKGQKYPITKLGVRNLTSELVAVATNDINFGECEVQVSQNVLGTTDGPKRPVTVLEVTHPTPRRNFRFHKAQVFIDNELRVPIRYAAYMWPENPGEAPPLEEEYTYLNLKVNNGFTDATFSKDNPEIFKD
jgi:hypothetical protein